MPRVRPALLPFVGLLVLELAAWPLALMSGLAIDDELRLRREGVEAVARVMSMRARYVRYELDVPGVGTFTHRDRSGREELWAAVAPGAIREAEAGRVRVLYLPDDPRVSRPVEAAPGVSPLGDPLAALLFLGLPLHVAAALLWGLAWRGLWQARAAASRGGGDGQRWAFWRLR